MEKPHGQKAYTNYHQSGERFNLAISNMLPLKDETGIYFVTTIRKPSVYVVAKIIPLYLILLGITGSIIHTELNILPYPYPFLMLFVFLIFFLKTEKTEGYTTNGLKFQKVRFDFMNAKATDYTTILPTGKENAISTNELAVIMGFSDSRSLQADIAKSRNAGQIILSSTQGGYYLPKDDAEVQEFVAVLRARAINTFRALKSAREYLQKDRGQMSFNDLEGIEDEL